MNSRILSFSVLAFGLFQAFAHAESVPGRCGQMNLNRGCYEVYVPNAPFSKNCVCNSFSDAERKGRCGGTVLRSCAAEGHSSDYCVQMARTLCGIN